MALVSKTFSQIITFTRASTGTYFDSAGVLQSAAIDTPRLDYNPSTLAAQGLLIEEARTNLVLQSQDFATTWTATASPTITTDTTAAPDGTTTADTIASTSSSSYVAQTITFTGDGTKAYSFFIKAGTSGNTRIFIRDATAGVSRGQVDIVWTGGVPSPTVTNGSLQSLQSCPNGWYRVSVIADSVVAANSNQFRIQPDNVSGTGDIIIWGFQAENGAFSTSYIPTTTTALTRSADVASVNTLSPWFNATEGTLFTEYSRYTNASAGRIATFSNGTNQNQIRINASVSTNIRPDWQVLTGGSVEANVIGAVEVAVNAVGKTAGRYATNNFQQATNGTLGTPDTIGTVPSVTTLHLGGNEVAGNLNGWLRRLTFYPRTLVNGDLQAITA